MKDTDRPTGAARRSSHGNEPAIQVICLGSSGGPSEDNVTGFLVRATTSKWSKGSLLAVDAGSHLAAITKILINHFPLVSRLKSPNPSGTDTASDPVGRDYLETDDDDSESGVSSPRDATPSTPMTVLETGPFAGLAFPYKSARANASYVVRDLLSTYLITHPHLDHFSGFTINTASFHNTSRPKRLAALPFTVNAIKTHIFNDLIWPNLTDEDGGVGFVTFQRLAEGGNIALGEGSGRGYIEVCEGLGVKGFKVSHGHCMKGPGHIHRGSNANLPDAVMANPQLLSAGDGRERRSISIPAASQPGTPLPGGAPGASERRSLDQCVIDSTAFFIRAESTSPFSPHSSAPAREILVFGDVEPDSISLSPRNSFVWAEAAPKIASGTLKGIFIECSYADSQGDAVLFGHLAPRHLITELSNLADMVRDARREIERERESRRKRKRSSGSHLGVSAGDREDERGRRRSTGRVGFGGLGISEHPASGSGLASAASSAFGGPPDEIMKDYLPSPRFSGTPGRASPPLGHIGPTHTSTPLTVDHGPVSSELTKSALTSPTKPVWPDKGPLKGVKVVIIHVKDTLADGPLIGERILQELEAHEKRLAETGKPLGCKFLVSESGSSYFF